MSHETFADGIGRIAIIDGIVRLDLIAYSPTEHGPDGKPRQVFTHRVVMGMDQFLFASEKIAKTAEMIRQQAGQPQQQPVQPQQPAVSPQAAPKPKETPSPQPPSVPQQFRREDTRPGPATPPPAPPRPFP